MTVEQDEVFPSRWKFLLLWWFCQSFFITVFMMVMGWQARVVDSSRNVAFGLSELSELGEQIVHPEAWTFGLELSIAMAFLQAILIFPIRRPRPTQSRGMPVLLALAVAGLLIAVLLVAAGALVVAAVDLAIGLAITDISVWTMAGLGLGTWGVSTVLLVRWSVGRRHEDVLSRVAHRILQGTILEFIAMIPIDVMIRRRTSCYCDEQTFWVLIGCGVIGTIALGPAVWVPMIARRRKAWYGGRCAVCGYDMRSTMDAACCPECGTGWKDSKMTLAAETIAVTDESDRKGL